MSTKDPKDPKGGSIQLRGSPDEDIQRILAIVEKIDVKPEKKDPKKDPEKKVSEVFQEKTTAELERDKALEENKKLIKQQRESLLESFREDEQEYYKDHSLDDLILLVGDRKKRKENLFLNDPDNPTPEKKTQPTINRQGDNLEITFDQDDVPIGYGQTVHGVGWYNSKGEIVSTKKGDPHGVKKK